MAIKNLQDIELHLFICNGGSCVKLGAEETTDIIRTTVKKMGFFDAVHTTKTLCNGRCDDAPLVITMPQGKWYKKVYPVSAQEFTTLLLNKKPIPESHSLYTYGDDFAHGISKT